MNLEPIRSNCVRGGTHFSVSLLISAIYATFGSSRRRSWPVSIPSIIIINSCFQLGFDKSHLMRKVTSFSLTEAHWSAPHLPPEKARTLVVTKDGKNDRVDGGIPSVDLFNDFTPGAQRRPKIVLHHYYYGNWFVRHHFSDNI